VGTSPHVRILGDIAYSRSPTASKASFQAQLGHTEPAFSMKVYTSAIRRRERLVGVALREFDHALHWALMGTSPDTSLDEAVSSEATVGEETA